VELNAGDKEYEKLMNSVEEFGYVEPIVWNKQTGNIVGGVQRVKVLQELGYTEIDSVVIDMDSVREVALNIALNKITGRWDVDKLHFAIQNLEKEGFTHDITGFEQEELDKMFKKLKRHRGEIEEDEFDVEKELDSIETPLSQLGDIWMLGKHRLMCGDSISAEDIAKLMGDKRARMIFTDPPWNVDYGGAAHPSWKQRTIMNDKMSTQDFYNFLSAAFKSMASVSLAGCPTYVVMSAQEWGSLMNVMRECGYHWSSTIIWAKNSLIVSRKDYHTQYEPIWYGWLEGAARLFSLIDSGDRKQSDLWEIDRPTKSPLHPTTKPIELAGRAINNSSQKDDVVLDLFGGSGTTLIASEQTGRVCHMMELDPKYADCIVKRYILQMDNNDADVFLLRDGEKIHWIDVPQPQPQQTEEAEKVEEEGES
jgi:DNA modification methylase